MGNSSLNHGLFWTSWTVVQCPLWAKSELTRGKKSWLAAALVQAGALLINHIAPGKRTLTPSA